LGDEREVRRGGRRARWHRSARTRIKRSRVRAFHGGGDWRRVENRIIAVVLGIVIADMIRIAHRRDFAVWADTRRLSGARGLALCLVTAASTRIGVGRGDACPERLSHIRRGWHQLKHRSGVGKESIARVRFKDRLLLFFRISK
jgi:hypothetical protein